MDVDVICELTRHHETVARTWNFDVGPHKLTRNYNPNKLPEL